MTAFGAEKPRPDDQGRKCCSCDRGTGHRPAPTVRVAMSAPTLASPDPTHSPDPRAHQRPPRPRGRDRCERECRHPRQGTRHRHRCLAQCGGHPLAAVEPLPCGMTVTEYGTSSCDRRPVASGQSLPDRSCRDPLAHIGDQDGCTPPLAQHEGGVARSRITRTDIPQVARLVCRSTSGDVGRGQGPDEVAEYARRHGPRTEAKRFGARREPPTEAAWRGETHAPTVEPGLTQGGHHPHDRGGGPYRLANRCRPTAIVQRTFNRFGPPSSSGLGRLPFTQVTRVRIPLGVLFRSFAPILVPWCSLECTPPCQGGGREFKSRRDRSSPALIEGGRVRARGASTARGKRFGGCGEIGYHATPWSGSSVGRATA